MEWKHIDTICCEIRLSPDKLTKALSMLYLYEATFTGLNTRVTIPPPEPSEQEQIQQMREMLTIVGVLSKT